jgi:hypothetical protein
MPVNYEVKGMLARLLSTEDIVVEHRKVETACFDVQRRILTLPMWERASNNVYDLLLSHESGHALYTPNEDWTVTHKIPPQFVNIVEDARIEKLLKRRYAGLSKTFYNGYKELADNDFFGIGGEDISEFNLADRINLYFKIGTHLNLNFTPEEQSIIDLIADCETFNDVLEAAEILYKYCKEDHVDLQNLNLQMEGDFEVVASDSNFNNNQPQKSDKQEGNSQSPSQSEPSDSPDDKEEKDSEQPSQQMTEQSQPEQPSNTESSIQSQGSIQGPDINVKTVEALNKAIEKLANNNTFENNYIETPDLDINQIIIPFNDIHKLCKEAWNSLDPNIFSKVDKEYVEFKRSSQKEVNYLVKEFERRKAADAYVRSATARTGVLDCSKLHTYKYNDDLFKKITVRPDGKNHGLIFILDWSGSMNGYLFDTIKQLYNLIWFCKKLSIPFEVYTFTTEYPFIRYDEKGNVVSRKLSYQEKDGIVQVAYWFSLMNFFSSKVSTSVLETQMKNIFRIAYAIDRPRVDYRVPAGLGLSGTPLCETFISLEKIIPKFRSENKLQKVQCVVLTDGDSCGIKYHRQYEGEKVLGYGSIGQNTILRNRKTGRTYNFNCNWWDIPNVFLRNLADMFPDTNLIGIRLVSSRDASGFIRRYVAESKSFDKTMEQWRKEKAFTIKTSGYESYFGICSSSLSQETEFEVSEDASKSQIKNAFMKSLKVKKMNKRILGEFIELIV